MCVCVCVCVQYISIPNLIKQPPMSNARLALVEKAFNILDTSGDGVITHTDISKVNVTTLII